MLNFSEFGINSFNLGITVSNVLESCGLPEKWLTSTTILLLGKVENDIFEPNS